ncbi:hypothetical protein BX616_010519 [Lobosporangium transversale]|nr:hypothetical protein BX616_010519 [Lobosporangium transversale]
MLASVLRRATVRHLSGTAAALPNVSSRMRVATTRLSVALVHSRNITSNSTSSQQQQQQQPQSAAARQFIEGLRQKNIPSPGSNEDAAGAISGFMNMFNDKESKTVTITACTKHGFVTTEAITLQGPVLCIGGQVFLWDIFKESGAIAQSLEKSSDSAQKLNSSQRSIFETIDEKTAQEIFKIFELMNPRPEILVIGTGKAFAPLSPAIRSVIRNLGIQVDMMSTANAAATYNMLAEEGRDVAAALLPLEPSTVQIVHGSQ